MAQTSYPFDGLDTSETEYSLLFRELQDTGVVGAAGELLVTADSTGMNVKVAPGMAVIRGHGYQSTAVETLEILASQASPRIDTVLLRLDPTANTILLDVLKGNVGTNPVPKPLTQTEAGIFEEALAYVAVAAGAVTISAANVTDVRPRTGTRVGHWPTTARRPLNAIKTRMGFNDQTGRWEWHNGTDWVDLISWATLPDKPTGHLLDGRSILTGSGVPSPALGVDGDFYARLS